MSRSFQPGRLSARRVILWAGILLGLSLVLMAWATSHLFSAALKPELDSRSQLIASIVREDLESALALGIDLASISGSEAYLEGVLAHFSEVKRIVLMDPSGTEVAVAVRAESDTGKDLITPDLGEGMISHLILRQNTVIGELRIEMDPRFLETTLSDVFLDIGVIGLIAVLLSFEMVVWVTSGAFGKPLDRISTLLGQQALGRFEHIILPGEAGSFVRIARRLSDRAQDVAARSGAKVRRLGLAYFVDIRLPAFLFSLGTEISTAYMPIYARQAEGAAWLAGDLAATAPLITYLLALAVIAPFGGAITDKLPPRTLFLICVPITAATMVGVGLSETVLGIAFWHGMMALIYGVATVACLEYAIRKAALPGFVEEARALDADLVLTFGTSVTLGMAGRLADAGDRRFVTDRPLVFMYVADPFGTGIAESFEHSGRANITAPSIACLRR